MRFISHATRAKYVFRPTYKTIVNGTQPVVHKGLQARFFGHVFDSEKSQRELGWTTEERKQVEEYLLGHKDFNHPHGFYLENVVDGVTKTLPQNAVVCIAFFENEAGEAEQCGNPTVEGTDYCEAHQPELAIAGED